MTKEETIKDWFIHQFWPVILELARRYKKILIELDKKVVRI